MMKTYHSSFDRHKQLIDKKAEEEFTSLKVKCNKCGHTMIMVVQQDYEICNHCGNKVFNNSKPYFMYKLRKEINKNEL